MAMVAARCTQCGAVLQVDSSQETALCRSCDTPFITEKAINNYNINSAQINAHTINIHMGKDSHAMFATDENQIYNKRVKPASSKKGPLIALFLLLAAAAVFFTVFFRSTESSIWADKPTGLSGFNYKVNQNTGEIIIEKYKGLNKNVWIADKYEVDGKEYSVTFEENAVFVLKSVKSVIIPEGVTYLTNNFLNSSGIEYLYLPSTLQSVGSRGTNFFSYIRHKIKEIYFAGSSEQWQKLIDGADPEYLRIVAVYYNATFENGIASGELFSLSNNIDIPNAGDINDEADGAKDRNFDNTDDTIMKALLYNIAVADGIHIRPESIFEEDDNYGDYYYLVGSLAAGRAAAFLNSEHIQDYRTLYYALHWRNTYIDEFGADDYMNEAEQIISTLISDEDFNKISKSFD